MLGKESPLQALGYSEQLFRCHKKVFWALTEPNPKNRPKKLFLWLACAISLKNIFRGKYKRKLFFPQRLYQHNICEHTSENIYENICGNIEKINNIVTNILHNIATHICQHKYWWQYFQQYFHKYVLTQICIQIYEWKNAAKRDHKLPAGTIWKPFISLGGKWNYVASN